MMYRIKITYETGSTGHSYTEEKDFDVEWSNIDLAKEALRSIIEHKKLCKELEDARRYGGRFVDRSAEEVKDEMNTKAWFIHDNHEFYIKVRTDNGVESGYAFWMGYFETIHRAEIYCTDINSDMSHDF